MKISYGQSFIHTTGCSCSSCLDKLEKTPKFDFREEIEMAGTKRTNISIKMKGDMISVIWTNRFGALQNFPCFIEKQFYDITKLFVKYEDGLLTIYCPLKAELPPAPPEEPEIDIEIK